MTSPTIARQMRELITNYGVIGSAGIAKAIERTARKPGSTESTLTRDQVRFLAEAVAAADIAKNTRVPTYQHPGTSAAVVSAAGIGRAREQQATAAGITADPAPLTQSQVAYLTRLPTDPARITYDDAVRVLTLAAKPVADADVPLVRSIVAPLRAHHDRQAALTALRGLSTSTPAPVMAAAALAPILQAENDQLTDSEALARAITETHAIRAARDAGDEQKRAGLRNELAALDAADEERRALSRGDLPQLVMNDDGQPVPA